MLPCSSDCSFVGGMVEFIFTFWTSILTSASDGLAEVDMPAFGYI